MRHTKMALAVLISNRKRVWRWCPKTTWNKNLKKNCPDLCHPQTGPYLIICLSAEHLSIRCDSHIIKKQRRYTQFTHWVREYVCVCEVVVCAYAHNTRTQYIPAVSSSGCYLSDGAPGASQRRHGRASRWAPPHIHIYASVAYNNSNTRNTNAHAGTFVRNVQ